MINSIKQKLWLFLLILITTGNFSQIIGISTNWHGLFIILFLGVILFAIPLLLSTQYLASNNSGIYYWIKSNLGNKVAMFATSIFWLSMLISFACCLTILGRFFVEVIGLNTIWYGSVVAVIFYLIILILNFCNIQLSSILIISFMLIGFFLPLLATSYGGIITLLSVESYSNSTNYNSLNYLIQIPTLFFGLEVISYRYKLLPSHNLKLLNKIFFITLIFITILFALSALLFHSSLLHGRSEIYGILNRPGKIFLAGLHFSLHQLHLTKLYSFFIVVMIISISFITSSTMYGININLQIAINDNNPYHKLTNINRFKSPYFILLLESIFILVLLLLIAILTNIDTIILNLLNVSSIGLMIYYILIFIAILTKKYNAGSISFKIYICLAILFCISLIFIAIYPSIFNTSKYYFVTISIGFMTIIIISYLLNRTIFYENKNGF